MKHSSSQKTSENIDSPPSLRPRHPHKQTAISEIHTDLPDQTLRDGLPDDSDTIERKRIEAELRRLTAIVQNLNDAVIIQTIEGKILAWNHGAELMYGYTNSEVLGRNINDVFPPSSDEQTNTYARYIKCANLAESFETKRTTKDGRTVNTWVTVTTLVDASEQIEAIATTERDITPVVNAEETIRILQSELSHMSRVHVVGEVAATMAHELNQPLCAIGTNARAAQRMIDAGSSITTISSALDDIIEDVDRASGVIKNLKDQLRRCEPEYSILKIHNIIIDIAPIAEALGRSENTEIVFELGNTPGETNGDRIQIQQVLLNLIRNGLDAMKEITEKSRKLLIRTQTQNNETVVSVHDHGQGLSPEIAEHMFEPFYTTKSEGMGMGLAICSSIVTAHQGRIWAANNPDGGCTVSFSLPLIQEDFN